MTISDADLAKLAADAVEDAIQDLAHDRMGQGEKLEDELDGLSEEEQEAVLNRFEAAIRRSLPAVASVYAPTPQQVLDTPMQDNDAEASTVREYLVKLLLTLWVEGEGFSGKKPFGNSNWECELYRALVKAGLVDGGFDEDDDLDYRFANDQEDEANKLISDAIRSFGSVDRG